MSYSTNMILVCWYGHPEMGGGTSKSSSPPSKDQSPGKKRRDGKSNKALVGTRKVGANKGTNGQLDPLGFTTEQRIVLQEIFETLPLSSTNKFQDFSNATTFSKNHASFLFSAPLDHLCKIHRNFRNFPWRKQICADFYQINIFT